MLIYVLIYRYEGKITHIVAHDDPEAAQGEYEEAAQDNGVDDTVSLYRCNTQLDGFARLPRSGELIKEQGEGH